MNETGRARRIHIGLVCCLMFMGAVKVIRSTKQVCHLSVRLSCLSEIGGESTHLLQKLG